MSAYEKSWFLPLAAVLIFGWAASGSFAKTIEIEDEDAVVATPTPRPKPASQAAPRPKKAAGPASGKSVKMGETIGFYYFLKAGFVTRDLQGVPATGKVRNLGSQRTYSTPHKCRLEPAGEQALFQSGDRLVVFRVKKAIQDERSGFSGYWVQNLAVLKVTESGDDGIIGETVKTFSPFQEGDWVRPYNEEMDRWNQASAPKSLPSGLLHCFVAAGEGAIENTVQPGFVILTAGTDQGVVEGMVFEIRESVKAGEGIGKGAPAGSARVFFAGGDYCMAQVLHGPEPIRKGCEAYYQP